MAARMLSRGRWSRPCRDPLCSHRVVCQRPGGQPPFCLKCKKRKRLAVARKARLASAPPVLPREFQGKVNKGVRTGGEDGMSGMSCFADKHAPTGYFFAAKSLVANLMLGRWVEGMS